MTPTHVTNVLNILSKSLGDRTPNRVKLRSWLSQGSNFARLAEGGK